MAIALPPERELLALHLRTSFTLDVRGCLVATNEPNPSPAPRIWVTRSGSESLTRFRGDVPERFARSWLACGGEAAVRAAVAEHSPVTHEHRGPAFFLPAQGSPGPGAVDVGSSTPLHPELLTRGWKQVETPPYFGVVRDGLVVAVCYSSRSGPEAAEAGVETAEGYRGRGLALDAVRAWAAAVQGSDRLAFYSTNWENEASLRVAAKLGAEQYAEDWHLT